MLPCALDCRESEIADWFIRLQRAFWVPSGRPFSDENSEVVVGLQSYFTLHDTLVSSRRSDQGDVLQLEAGDGHRARLELLHPLPSPQPLGLGFSQFGHHRLRGGRDAHAELRAHLVGILDVLTRGIHQLGAVRLDGGLARGGHVESRRVLLARLLRLVHDALHGGVARDGGVEGLDAELALEAVRRWVRRRGCIHGGSTLDDLTERRGNLRGLSRDPRLVGSGRFIPGAQLRFGAEHVGGVVGVDDVDGLLDVHLEHALTLDGTRRDAGWNGQRKERVGAGRGDSVRERSDSSAVLPDLEITRALESVVSRGFGPGGRNGVGRHLTMASCFVPA